MVARWLESYMFKGRQDGQTLAKQTAKYFNDAFMHKSHGRRIDRDEARKQGVVVEELEADQKLQEAVLTSYHVMTIAIETSPAVKMMHNNHGRLWLKNHNPGKG